jgi:hypothetical protein
MEMQQMAESVVAKMDASPAAMKANQAKTDANIKEVKEDIKTNPAKMDCHHEKLMTIMKAGKHKTEAMREACLEKTEVCLERKEPTPVEIESVAIVEEVPKVEAAVETARSL